MLSRLFVAEAPTLADGTSRRRIPRSRSHENRKVSAVYSLEPGDGAAFAMQLSERFSRRTVACRTEDAMSLLGHKGSPSNVSRSSLGVVMRKVFSAALKCSLVLSLLVL